MCHWNASACFWTHCAPKEKLTQITHVRTHVLFILVSRTLRRERMRGRERGRKRGRVREELLHSHETTCFWRQRAPQRQVDSNESTWLRAQESSASMDGEMGGRREREIERDGDRDRGIRRPRQRQAGNSAFSEADRRAIMCAQRQVDSSESTSFRPKKETRRVWEGERE